MRAKRRYHLGVPFWVFVFLALLIAVVAMNGGYNLLFWVFGVMTASLLLSGIVSGGMLVHLGVVRTITKHGVVGQPLLVRYEMRNGSRLFPAFSIHFEERTGRSASSWNRMLEPTSAWVMHAGPKETVHGESIYRPMRRGVVRFDELRLWTRFPFGLIRKSVSVRQPQHTLVFPRVYALRRSVLAAVAPTGSVGSRISSHAGAGDDYYGLREYREGDSMRHIAWKRNAGQDELVCIERTRPNPPRVRVVVDLRRPTIELRIADDDVRTARELEELAISLAASIVHAADQEGYEIGLTILGSHEPSIPVRRNHWHRDRIMAALAGIELDVKRVPFNPGRRDELGHVGEHAGLVIVHPDRPDLELGRHDAWHFTGRQIDELVTGEVELDVAPAPRHETAAAPLETSVEAPAA